MKTETITLNIGLQIEAKDKVWTIEQAKSMVRIHGNITKERKFVGVWNNAPQESLICEVEMRGNRDTIIQQVQNYCLYLEQECIATKFSDGVGMLIYHPRHKGDKLPFDETYFVNLTS